MSEQIDIEKVIEAAKAGGEVLKKYFGQTLEVIPKTKAADFKTKADIESEAAILAVLDKNFPTFNIYSEEAGEIKKNSEYTFYIDPLDGTNNFVLGIPNFSVSIGLVKNNEILAGVIYSPMVENLCHAIKGQGAFCEGKKLSVNKETNIKNATVCHNCGYNGYHEHTVSAFDKLYSKKAKRFMSNWSPTFDFCMLALGRVESIINNNSELYDFTAGKLIAKEAGAVITDFNGTPEESELNRQFVISCNNEINNQVLEAVK